MAATEAIIGDAPQSVDSFAWFRSSRDDIARHRDGLTLDGQGLSPVTLTAAKLLPASSRTAGDRFWLDQVRTVHTATAAAYGLVTVADPDDPATRLTGGRLLQRIHLAATGLGLGLQHMNEVTERIDREASTRATPTFTPPRRPARHPGPARAFDRSHRPPRATRASEPPSRPVRGTAVTAASVAPAGLRTDAGRRILAAQLAVAGGTLGVLAGVAQAAVGARFPAWSGAKEQPLRLGLLTVALSVVALAVGLWLRTGRVTAGRRAAVVVGVGVPAVLSFSTVGRLWFVPGALLLAAVVLLLAAGGVGELVAVARQEWPAVLVSVLGACQILVAVSATPLGIAVLGVVGGLALGACPWWKGRGGRWALPLGALGTVAFAVLTCTSLVSPLVAVLALGLLTVHRHSRLLAAEGHHRDVRPSSAQVTFDPSGRRAPR